MKDNEDSRNPDPKQWWEIYNGVWAKGSKMRDIALGFVEEKSINPDLKEIFENEKKELHNPLAESAFVKDLMDYDALKFQDRVLDVLVDIEKLGKMEKHVWEPLADLPPATMLMLQEKEVRMNLKIALDSQAEKVSAEYMERRKETIKIRTNIQTKRNEQSERMEKNRRDEKEVAERRETVEEKVRADEEEEKKQGSDEIDWQSAYGRALKKIEEREVRIERELKHVFKRQEERIAKEKVVEQGFSKEYGKYFEKLLDPLLFDRPKELEDIKKHVEKLNKNQEERLAREKHGVDVTKSLEDIQAVQVLLVKRQEERIAKEEVEGKMKIEKERVQMKTDMSQDEKIEKGKETDMSQDEKIHQLRNDLDSLGLVVKFNFALVIIVILAFGYFVLSR